MTKKMLSNNSQVYINVCALPCNRIQVNVSMKISGHHTADWQAKSKSCEWVVAIKITDLIGNCWAVLDRREKITESLIQHNSTHSSATVSKLDRPFNIPHCLRLGNYNADRWNFQWQTLAATGTVRSKYTINHIS